MRILRFLRPILERRNSILIAAIIGAILAAPSLCGGFVADDHFMRMVTQGFPGMEELARSPLNTFEFASGDAAYNLQFKDRGLIPWFSYDTVRLSFWRPLVSLTHYFDTLVWGDHAWVMHLENIACYVLVICACGILYRRLIETRWVAGLAALLFAVDKVHAMPVGWIANRNALMAVFFGVLTLIAHDRWRRDGWRLGAVLAPLALGVGLLCGEAAVAAGAYLFAYALFLDRRGRWWGRLAALIPYGALVVVWHGAYERLGYGAVGSGMYLDPGTETGLYVQELVRRFPVLMLAQFGGIPSPFFIFIPESMAWLAWTYVGVAVAFIAVMLYLAAPVLARNATSRFWLLGTALAALPVCATFPMDRLLLFVSVGAMGLVAEMLGFIVETTAAGPLASGARGRGMRWLGVYWVVVFLVISPSVFPFRTHGMRQAQQSLNEANDSAPASPDIVRKDLVIVNAPNDFMAWHLPIMRSSLREPTPRHCWALNMGIRPVTLTRTDANTLILRPEGGFVQAPWARMFRGPAHSFSVGYSVRLSGLTIEVLSVTSQGMPDEVRFRFDVPLEDPSLVWVDWEGDLHMYVNLDGRYHPFTPPKVGESVRISVFDGDSAHRDTAVTESAADGAAHG